MTTPQFGMDELQPSQSQPEVIVNAGLRTLEASISIRVLDKDLTTPPASPVASARYIVAAGATGAWAGHDGKVAYLQGDTWYFLTPQAGWFAWADDEAQRYQFVSGGWAAFSGGAISVLGPDESPPVNIANVSSIEFVNSVVEDLGGGAARVTSLGGGGGSADEGHGSLTTVGISSGTAALDHSLGADFDLQLTENVTTLNHTGVTNGDANWFTLRIRQDGTGGRTFAPPASWRYPSGVSAYTVSSGASDVDLVQGVTYDNGATWMVSYEKDYT